jgi:hypothetical protein
VIGAADDPATPLAQARAVTRALERGRLLVTTGEQHTSFGRGNACVDGVVTRYLVRRALPGKGAHC